MSSTRISVHLGVGRIYLAKLDGRTARARPQVCGLGIRSLIQGARVPYLTIQHRLRSQQNFHSSTLMKARNVQRVSAHPVNSVNLLISVSFEAMIPGHEQSLSQHMCPFSPQVSGISGVVFSCALSAPPLPNLASLC